MKSNKINLTILFTLIVVIFSAPLTAQENSNNFTAPHSLLTMYNSKNYLGVNHKLNNAINQKLWEEYHTNAIDK